MTWPYLGRQPEWCPPRRCARHQRMTIVRAWPWYERRPNHTQPDQSTSHLSAGAAVADGHCALLGPVGGVMDLKPERAISLDR